jgi:hypothetical protein
MAQNQFNTPCQQEFSTTLRTLSGFLLHILGQRLNLGAIALIGRGDRQRKQVAQRVDGDVGLRALAPFGAVVACQRTVRSTELAGPACSLPDVAFEFPLIPSFCEAGAETGSLCCVVADNTCQ